MRLGPRQIDTLMEAANEVVSACPWVWIDYRQRRQVNSLRERGLVGATDGVFGIMPRGCLIVRRYDRRLARKALAGLKRESASGTVMPWDV